MLFTRRGDNGTSGLFGTPDRFLKDAPIFEALGTVDELNAFIGLCFTKVPHTDSVAVAPMLRAVQEKLFIIQAELAGAPKSLTIEDVESLEHTIASIEALIQNPHGFVIPGATEYSALLDVARTVSRRAERRVVSVGERVSADTRRYLNRLSSLLYALARFAAQSANSEEQHPSY